VLWRIILPYLFPAWLTGFALSFARAVGEYGSVVFISGNMPMTTEISPFLIMTKLEQYDYAGATAIAVVMLLISFVLLLTVNAAPVVEQQEAGALMAGHAGRLRTARATTARGLTEPAPVRWLLTAVDAGISRSVSRRAARGGVRRSVRERSQRLPVRCQRA
jgi:ABC-type phosphate transport system permease subunit